MSPANLTMKRKNFSTKFITLFTEGEKSHPPLHNKDCRKVCSTQGQSEYRQMFKRFIKTIFFIQCVRDVSIEGLHHTRRAEMVEWEEISE